MNEAAVRSSTPIELRLSPPPPSKGEREYHAFLRMLPDLLTTHRGRFVAVHNEQIVDDDMDDIALVQRVHARFGYVPIHVGLVADPLPVTRVPHYRTWRPAEQGA